LILTTGKKPCIFTKEGRKKKREKKKALTLGVFCVGKRAFIAGVADDHGYGWAIAKSLAAAGAEILVGTWVPVSKSA
jgi:hypothetical protein